MLLPVEVVYQAPASRRRSVSRGRQHEVSILVEHQLRPLLVQLLNGIAEEAGLSRSSYKPLTDQSIDFDVRPESSPLRRASAIDILIQMERDEDNTFYKNRDRIRLKAAFAVLAWLEHSEWVSSVSVSLNFIQSCGLIARAPDRTVVADWGGDEVLLDRHITE